MDILLPESFADGTDRKEGRVQTPQSKKTGRTLASVGTPNPRINQDLSPRSDIPNPAAREQNRNLKDVFDELDPGPKSHVLDLEVAE